MIVEMFTEQSRIVSDKEFVEVNLFVEQQLLINYTLAVAYRRERYRQFVESGIENKKSATPGKFVRTKVCPIYVLR